MEIEKIGENAGKVWHELNKGKELSIPELSRLIDLSHEDTTLAIGWLARENKVYIQLKERSGICKQRHDTRTIFWLIIYSVRKKAFLTLFY